MAKKAKGAGIGVEVDPQTLVAPADRTRDLALAIHSAVSPLLDVDSTKADAKKAFQDAGVEATNMREAIMAKLATLAVRDGWREPEIDTALNLATQNGGVGNAAETASAIASFKSEIKLATLPGMAEHFHTLLAIRDAAWAAEEEEVALAKEQERAQDTPVRKLFSRGYHALLFMLRSIKNDGRIFESVDDFVSYCRDNDPDFDVKKVLARLNGMRKTLAQFHADFPVEDLGDMLANLNAITEEDLTTARAKKLGLDKRKATRERMKSNTAKRTAKASQPSPESCQESEEGAVATDTEVMEDETAPINEVNGAQDVPDMESVLTDFEQTGV